MEIAIANDNESLYGRAILIASNAHRGQVRKYTNAPYIQHPIRVSQMVYALTLNKEAAAAAVLHDVIEDTDLALEKLRKLFPENIVQMVDDLTEKTTLEDGNRARRKAMECERLSKCSAVVQTIKICDLVDNGQSIAEHDPKFWSVYRKEAKQLCDALTKADMQARYILLSDVLWE